METSCVQSFKQACIKKYKHLKILSEDKKSNIHIDFKQILKKNKSNTFLKFIYSFQPTYGEAACFNN